VVGFNCELLTCFEGNVMKSSTILGFFIPLAFLFSCTNNPPTTNLPEPIELNIAYDDFTINDLDFSQRWFGDRQPVGLIPNYPHDDDGIILTNFNGQWCYHPWGITSKAIEYIESYNKTGDSLYLPFIYKYARKIVALGDRANGGIWIPYTFNLVLNGNSNEVIMAPWYSGLAQGHALCFFSRSYELIHDPYFKIMADSFFSCFLSTDTLSAIWVALSDSSQNYWIEEYPFSPPNHVLNGFVTTFFCLYDYFQITDDSNCEIILKAGLTTVKKHMYEYRCRGGVCYYDLRYKSQYSSYQDLVINQFRKLAQYTSDPSFSAFADSLYSDYH
jgi:hypothetical protein